MTIRVSALFRHPLKSGAPVAVEELALDEFGAVGDRRWMLIDENGVAITQREEPRLALLRAEIAGDGIILNSPDLPPLHVRQSDVASDAREAMVFDDVVHVNDAGDRAGAWCSAHMGVACRLTHVALSTPRMLRPKYAGGVDPSGRRIALSDGAPMLLLGEGSLSLLNAKLVERGEPVLGVERFRPNVLLAGTEPHEEDTWHAITIGDVDVGVGTSCPRCVITTTDQITTERGVEPLRTLATYRKQPGGVMFGVNASHAQPGVIRVGDPVTVRAFKG